MFNINNIIKKKDFFPLILVFLLFISKTEHFLLLTYKMGQYNYFFLNSKK